MLKVTGSLVLVVLVAGNREPKRWLWLLQQLPMPLLQLCSVRFPLLLFVALLVMVLLAIPVPRWCRARGGGSF